MPSGEDGRKKTKTRRRKKGEPPSFDALLEKMLGRARRFNVEKVREEDIGRSGGPPAEEAE